MTLQSPLDGLTEYQPSERTRLVLALAKVREEWQETALEGSLLDIEIPVGLLLHDIAAKLQLSPQERHVFLGGRLIGEVEIFLETPISKKLAN